MESDQCKMGSGGDGMGAVMMGGGMMGGGMNMMGGVDPTSVCATHGKKRGARNLQPHASAQGVFVCLESDPCK